MLKFHVNRTLLGLFASRLQFIRLSVTKNMSWVSVRKIPSEERLQISFTLTVTEMSDRSPIQHHHAQPQAALPTTVTGSGPAPEAKHDPDKSSLPSRTFQMDRLQNETLDKTFMRIQTNVAKFLNTNNKKRKKQVKNSNVSVSRASDSDTAVNTNTPQGGAQGTAVNTNTPQGGAQGTAVNTNTPQGGAQDPEEMLTVRLYGSDGNEVDGSVTNSEAWQEGSTLVIAKQELPVRVNVPSIQQLTLPNCIMVGFCIHALIDAEFSDLEQCTFDWFREETVIDPVDSSGKNKSDGADRWVRIGSGPWYTPSIMDTKCRLRLECTPGGCGKVGRKVAVTSKNPVTPGPGYCPYERRHLETQHLTDCGSFRIVTYNILANLYADSDFSRDYLYPYCPAHALEQDYRKHLILKELTGYNSDIICLQEVDRRLFVSELLPALERQGFDGSLKLKMGQVPEGTATLYRKSKFRCLGRHDIALTQTLKERAEFADLWDKICQNPAMKEKMEERTSCFQVTALESQENSPQTVIVGTVHLYFHPKAPHIRIIQTIVCLRHLESVLELYTQQGVDQPTLVLCGDLNSYPEGGVHQYLSGSHIPSNHADWYAGGKSEFLDGMDYSHSRQLVSACGFPRYTNFVSSFTGCLDYIYIEKNRLKASKVVSMPTHEEVTKLTALPNPVFPSDHIALISELTWL